MPILNISSQIILFFISIASGFVMGGVYDIVRVFRRIIIHPKILMFFEDLIYWVFCTSAVFYIMLVMTKGEIRFFAIAGFFIGMLLYFCTISILFIKFSEMTIKFVKKIISKILSIIAVPFKLLYKLMCIIMRPFNKFFDKLLFSLKKVLKKYLRYVKIGLRRNSHKSTNKNEKKAKNTKKGTKLNEK